MSQAGPKISSFIIPHIASDKDGIFVNFMESLLSQVPFNVALKNKTSEDVSLLVIDSIVDGNENFGEMIL